MKISAVIPAYNEEERIRKVLEPLSKYSSITDIIVVDDGSEDNTSLIVGEFNHVNLIQLTKNRGKAEAIKEGLKYCTGDIIFLLDADLIGLNSQHIDSMLMPLLYNDMDMTVGIFQSGRLITDLAQKVAPNLSGQRAFKNKLLDDIKELNMSGYGIEIAISQYMKKNKIKYQQVFLKDISHVMKEEKLGFSKGMVWRLRMYRDILKNWKN